MHFIFVAQVLQQSSPYANQAAGGSSGFFQLYSFGGIAIVIAIYFLIRRYINSHRGSVLEKDLSNGPSITVGNNFSVLMTIYTLGVGLTKLSSGKIQNYDYSIFVTSPMTMTTYNNEKTEDPDADSVDAGIDDSLDFDKYDIEPGMGGHMRMSGLDRNKLLPIDMGQIRTPVNQVLIKIDLPVKSQVHIAGFSLQDNVFKTLLGNTNINYIMNQVNLEGDFPDYFKIYCQKDKEVEVREVLDPSAMEFLVDFCNQLNWELFENTLYFVQSGTNKKTSDNNVGVLKGAEDFVTKILPTLTRMQGSTPPVNTPQNTNESTVGSQ